MDAKVESTHEVEPRARVFISYSRKDMAFADRVEAALKARGFEPLIDRTEIYAFEDWWKRIEVLIARADTVVFVLSPDAVTSDVALKEVAYATSLNKRFAPIVCRPVTANTVPEALRRLNFIFFDDPAHFEASAEQLVEALETDIAWIRRHTEFGEAARRWIESGRASGVLLRPPVLDQAEAWLTYRPRGAPAPTSETEAFIAQSRKALLASQRLWRGVLGAVFALLFAIILGLVGWIKQDYLIAQWRWWTVTRPYAKAQVWPYTLSAMKEQALKPGDSFKECAKDCPEMVFVPAGSFIMGASSIEGQAQAPGYADEIPQHTVTIARPFAVSKFDVTFADWDACVAGGGCDGYEPDDYTWGRGRRPVIYVSWEDAQRYAAWLSAVTGKIYRLLSESEYEYATRAGTTTVYPWGNSIKLNGTVMAHCNGCGSQSNGPQTLPVGSFPPNKFGLYDMVGNVWGWTEDCINNDYNGAPTDGSAWLSSNVDKDCSHRMDRGGSWAESPVMLRSAHRGANALYYRSNVTGFRIARTLE